MERIHLLGRRRGSADGTLAELKRWFVRNQLLVEVGLWLTVALAFVLDSFTTTVGLQHGLVESNPVMRMAFVTFGHSIIWMLKGGAITIALGCWAVLPREERVLVPVVFGFPWVLAVVSNLGLLISA